jgi:hypothetical protein
VWLKIFYIFFTSVRIALFPTIMPVVETCGVMYELYLEESGIDFGYIQIFPSGL